ncbi:MAG TPA: radical SAM protein [Coleofasciculaceae cyanobacterium]
MSPFADETLLFEPAEPLPNALPTVFAFPNTYSVGITSLGYQVVWAMLAARPELAVARLFTDACEPLPRSPALVGFSMSWELDYVNVMALLEELAIPLHAVDRTDGDPIVFGGGPVLTANPEPFAAYFDVLLLGDGEIVIDALVNGLLESRDRPRAERLETLAQVPGLYVPQLYAVEYSDPTGPIAAIRPLSERIPAIVSKQTYRGNTLSASTVVTPRAAWENIFMVETVRSCPELCRFCLASYLTLPFRTANLDDSLIPAIDRGLQATNRLGLLGASVTQHPEFDRLLDHLSQSTYENVRLSVASVRTNTVTEKFARVLASRDCKSITVAVESGSETVRQIINKKLETDDIERAAMNAKAGGLSALKLYGMAGIPGETIEDIEATAAMMLRLKKAAPGLKLTLGCSTFVPKSHTPFQWFGINPDAEKRLKLLQKRLRSNGLDFRPESYNWSIIQTLISRGDRRLTPLLELVRAYGAGDTDNPDRVSLGSYRRAFKELRDRVPPLDYYVFRNWDLDEVLPWNHLQGPLPLATLKKHHDEAVSLMPHAVI